MAHHGPLHTPGQMSAHQAELNMSLDDHYPEHQYTPSKSVACAVNQYMHNIDCSSLSLYTADESQWDQSVRSASALYMIDFGNNNVPIGASDHLAAHGVSALVYQDDAAESPGAG